MKIGDRVYFGRPNGEQTLGEVVKINGKSIKIRQLEERGQLRTRSVGTIWRVAASLVRPADGAAVVVSAPVVLAPAPARRPEAEVIRDLQTVECQLSPENLTCDGEIRGSALMRRAAALHRRQKELLRELGRPLRDGELWAA